MTACLLILQYVNFELSYDDFHEKADRIYRVALHKYQDGGNNLRIATNYNALSLALRKDMPEIKLTTNFFSPTDGGNWVFSRQDENDLVQFDEKNIFHADEFFLQVFSFGMVTGDAATALKEPYSIVLTESAAQKYFGNGWKSTDVIGQTIRVSSLVGDHEHKITGIIKDVPSNSHLQFDLLLSISTYDDLYPEEKFAANWQCTKEIGIRKVLGASVQSIVALLSTGFIKLVLLASLLALPVAYLAMRQWLENYAFRIEISWWLLGLPVVMILVVALLAISLQTIKAALADPVDSLRYE